MVTGLAPEVIKCNTLVLDKPTSESFGAGWENEA